MEQLLIERPNGFAETRGKSVVSIGDGCLVPITQGVEKLAATDISTEFLQHSKLGIETFVMILLHALLCTDVKQEVVANGAYQLTTILLISRVCMY